MSEYLFDNPYLGLDFAGDGDGPDEGNDDLGDDPNVTVTPVHLGKVYHIPHGVPYHRENSVQGINYAKKHGYDAIDLDMQIDKQGVFQNAHWERPLDKDGFVDPLGQIPRKRQIQNMLTEHVSRLVAHDNGTVYHIDTMGTQFKRCASLGLKVRAEAKNDPEHWTLAAFKELKRQADSVRCTIVVATLDDYPEWREVLRRARHAGIDTRRLRA